LFVCLFLLLLFCLKQATNSSSIFDNKLQCVCLYVLSAFLLHGVILSSWYLNAIGLPTKSGRQAATKAQT
jgi:hypothetical protein